ncbi:ABC transporter permease [Roseovarius sp. SK2]|uniref:ABC transporter permease n=1 Tax=Roseovarius TaxID=74030 RepID=UPI00237B8B9B|nr:ABC transporter permease [Roseovarius sp. SK2]MDD9725983.1 ABC transporter permease [Roseovarius sp. SK2]
MKGPHVRDAILSVLVVAACFFLMLPTLAIVPVSFTSTEFITFPPVGFSLRWYEAFFSDPTWRGAAFTSLVVGLASTLLATTAGTLAAVGMARLSRRFAGAVQTMFILPLVIPTIITAVAVYDSFSKIGVVGTVPGLVLAHTILALPFVVINVSAIMQKVDWRIVDAARSLGATPSRAFFLVTLPAIRPGVFAGAAFAFLTSFDEVVVALFISGIDAVTLPVKMWSGIRFEISPTVAAVSCLLTLLSLLFVTVYALSKRR